MKLLTSALARTRLRVPIFLVGKWVRGGTGVNGREKKLEQDDEAFDRNEEDFLGISIVLREGLRALFSWSGPETQPTFICQKQKQKKMNKSKFDPEGQRIEWRWESTWAANEAAAAIDGMDKCLRVVVLRDSDKRLLLPIDKKCGFLVGLVLVFSHKKFKWSYAYARWWWS